MCLVVVVLVVSNYGYTAENASCLALGGRGVLKGKMHWR